MFQKNKTKTKQGEKFWGRGNCFGTETFWFRLLLITCSEFSQTEMICVFSFLHSEMEGSRRHFLLNKGI